MKKRTALLTISVLVLAGCGYKATISTPKAMVSGCEIHRVEIKDEHYPLYLAKCKDAATITYSTGGKNNRTQATVTTIESESADLALKKTALEKLTDDEKRVLGLQQ